MLTHSPRNHSAEYDFEREHDLVHGRHVSVQPVRPDHGLSVRSAERWQLEENADGGEQVVVRLEEG